MCCFDLNSERTRIKEWRRRVGDTTGVVVHIQRVYRGYVARLHAILLKQRQVLRIRQRYKLARIVQRLWRGFKYVSTFECAFVSLAKNKRALA